MLLATVASGSVQRERDRSVTFADEPAEPAGPPAAEPPPEAPLPTGTLRMLSFEPTAATTSFAEPFPEDADKLEASHTILQECGNGFGTNMLIHDDTPALLARDDDESTISENVKDDDSISSHNSNVTTDDDFELFNENLHWEPDITMEKDATEKDAIASKD